MLKIRIGTAQIIPGYGISSKKNLKIREFKKIIELAKKKKIFKIDTSEVYGNSHKILKKIQSYKTDIGTKILIKKEDNYIFLKKKILNFFKIFENKHINYILIHNFSQSNIKTISKNIRSLIKIRKETKNFKIGLSIYDDEDFIKLKKITKHFNVDIVQIPISIFNQSFLKKKYINFFKKKRIYVQARSIYLQGLILMSQKEIKNKLKFNDYNFFKNWDNFNKGSKKKKIFNCVQFVKKNKFIDEIVVGFQNSLELKEFLVAYNSKKDIELENLNRFKLSNKKIYSPLNWEPKYENL
jgi:diketogulonate reductase-like aldo/keto reductase